MSDRYDALQAPEPKAWLALDEQQRIDLVQDYHRRGDIDLPNAMLHATLHVIIENQIALGDETPVAAALARLMGEGLDRHEAIHAIGTVFMDLIYDVAHGKALESEANYRYYPAVERLAAADWLNSGDDSEDEAETFRILDAFAGDDGLPADAIRAATARRDLMVPAFRDIIEARLAAEEASHLDQALFFAFHLLGEWREKSAYRLLAKLLRLPSAELHRILGDAITETSHRVMAAVFDGDPQPLYDVVLDAQADEFVRSRMCEALAMLALRGEVARDEIARFLRQCHSAIKPVTNCFVWNGWQSAVAALGLAELKPLVEEAFERDSILRSLMHFEDFKQDLQQAVQGLIPEPWRREHEYELFGDTIAEFSIWPSFKTEEERKASSAAAAPSWVPGVPAVNPLRNVGRNDPCPCGSGKKFKKCCLHKDEAGIAA